MAGSQLILQPISDRVEEANEPVPGNVEPERVAISTSPPSPFYG